MAQQCPRGLPSPRMFSKGGPRNTPSVHTGVFQAVVFYNWKSGNEPKGQTTRDTPLVEPARGGNASDTNPHHAQSAAVTSPTVEERLANTGNAHCRLVSFKNRVQNMEQGKFPPIEKKRKREGEKKLNLYIQ